MSVQEYVIGDCLAIDISDEWVDHYKKRLRSDNSKLDKWL